MSVLFDQLRISDDGKRMYINVRVNKASYFDDIYLDSITIMTADTVSETNPHAPSEGFVYKVTLDGEYKEADLVLKPSDFNTEFQKADFSSDLFFIYIKVKGVPDPCTPCTLDEEITLGVVFDENVLYQKVMQMTKDLLKDCRIPMAFSDFILLWNAFKASIETEHYIPAIKFWNMLFDKVDKVSVTKPCGCHG